MSINVLFIFSLDFNLLENLEWLLKNLHERDETLCTIIDDDCQCDEEALRTCLLDSITDLLSANNCSPLCTILDHFNDWESFNKDKAILFARLGKNTFVDLNHLALIIEGRDVNEGGNGKGHDNLKSLRVNRVQLFALLEYVVYKKFLLLKIDKLLRA
jgi:hypothetical protein